LDYNGGGRDPRRDRSRSRDFGGHSGQGSRGPPELARRYEHQLDVCDPRHRDPAPRSYRYTDARDSQMYSRPNDSQRSVLASLQPLSRDGSDSYQRTINRQQIESVQVYGGNQGFSDGERYDTHERIYPEPLSNRPNTTRRVQRARLNQFYSNEHDQQAAYAAFTHQNHCVAMTMERYAQQMDNFRALGNNDL
jgi:hypothetical protein